MTSSGPFGAGPPDPLPAATGHARGRVTLQIIAERLGVSTATVSLALRGSPLVAQATRARVQKMSRDLGYSYNRSAASLRTDRTHILGVGFHDITNPYFAELLAAIDETTAAHGRSILLGTYGEDLERQDRVLGTLGEYRPDGMILCAAGGSTPETFAHLIAAGVPIVQLSREIRDDLDFVGSDDRHGTILAMEHLIGLGHRRIAFICENQAISTGRNRYLGYCDVLARNGIAVDPPTAAVCMNDLAAFGAMLGLRHRGREAGIDFSIVGCDDVQEAAQWYPALTTIRNFQDEMGRKSAEFLLRRIAEPGAPPCRLLLEPALVVRGTTAPLRR